jgi:hypothetical protein
MTAQKQLKLGFPEESYCCRWLEDQKAIIIDVPFAVKHEMEDADEFEERAERDFGIISMFVKRALRPRLQAAAVDSFMGEFRMLTTTSAAYAQGYIILPSVDRALLKFACDCLYDECIGNLPGQFAKGGLHRRSSHISQPRDAGSSYRRVDKLAKEFCQPAPAIELSVPNPE